MKITRKIIEIDDELCDGCGQCVPSCAEGAIQIIEGKAKLVKDRYCDGLGACLGECPTGALSVVERQAEEFDEAAVEKYLSSKAQEEHPEEATLASGCPSAQLQTFLPCREANEPVVHKTRISALSHWPVQIRLVPASAPFLKGADLLVAADCTTVAYANFHQDFIKGRVILVGCPKFDNVEEYIQRFAEIFHSANIKSIMIIVMEVPCCNGLPMIVEKGMRMAGEEVPLEIVMISTRGEILERKKSAA